MHLQSQTRNDYNTADVFPEFFQDYITSSVRPRTMFLFVERQTAPARATLDEQREAANSLGLREEACMLLAQATTDVHYDQEIKDYFLDLLVLQKTRFNWKCAPS
eukprot:3200891-Amphidinium_carterae.1